MQRVSVVIPSRSQPDQLAFLMQAIRSVRDQTARGSVSIEVVVGLDPDAELPALGETDLVVRSTAAHERSQAAALNAAAAATDGDFLAFLEDDDRWRPDHLTISLQALARCGFASTTQLEVDAKGVALRINDFPTPSGWVMPRSTWERVGAFNTEYRYHLDNEWLGRLADAEVDRTHVAEATAPATLALAAGVRPWLANVVTFGGGRVRLARHTSPLPNVVRLVHTASGMHRIATDATAKLRSDSEIAQLTARFGRFPW